MSAAHRRVAPHETTTPSGITLANPDQGTLFVRADLDVGSPGYLAVWEAFDEDEGGHNLDGFLERWDAWKRSQDPYLWTVEPRFGFPVRLEREVIAHVMRIGLDYWRREDVRAGVRGRGLAVPLGPGVRQVGAGAYEITVPRG